MPTPPFLSQPTDDQLAERVRYEGLHPTRERAEEVLHSVLAALGGQLPEAERAALADCLPPRAAHALTFPPTGRRPLTGWQFVEELAARTGVPQATARWDAGTVLILLARLAGEDLVSRVLARLPSGYALLFGRAELVQAA